MWRWEAGPSRGLRVSGRPAFTLIELLVVVAIVALLVAILLPALQYARAQARLTVCLANVRSQGTVLHQYVNDNDGRMPPQYVWILHTGPSEIFLLNRTLANYQGVAFPKDSTEHVYHTPTGIWRCPNVGLDDDYPERWTHSGILHYAPNKWLYNVVWIVEQAGEVEIEAEASGAWQALHGGSQWRMLHQIRRPAQIVALSDNVGYLCPYHQLRQGRESLGLSREIACDPNDTEWGDNVGAHEQLGRLPAVFVDGHAEALPTSKKYWLNGRSRYHPGGDAGAPTDVYDREVERFMWYVAPGEYVGPGGS